MDTTSKHRKPPYRLAANMTSPGQISPKKFIETKNCDELSDKLYLKMGLVFLSANDAVALANAMCGVDPGEPV